MEGGGCKYTIPELSYFQPIYEHESSAMHTMERASDGYSQDDNFDL